jgi:hypothetical protein
METSEVLPGGALDASDLDEVARREGPFLSLYLVTESGVENAAQRSEARWKTVRSGLAADGVPDDALLAVDGLVPDAHLRGDGLAVIADATGVLHVEHGPAPAVDEAFWEPLPRLLPILRWRQAEPSYVVVLIDRTGADLYGFRRGAPDASDARAAPDLQEEVRGDEYPIRKVAPGGWSQRRYQQRAENTWEENAEQVAQAVAAFVDRLNAELVIAAGDVRAVQLLRDSLPTEVERTLRVVQGERSPEPAGADIPDDVAAVVADHVHRQADALLEKFREERGQRDKATEGIDPTARALARAQAAVLLIADDPLDDRSLWFGPDPAVLGTDPRQVADLGVETPQRGRARDALVRAAIGTSAAIRVLDSSPRTPAEEADPGEDPAPSPEVDGPGAPRDGVGALLRWGAG